ncbi:MAG: SDR family oxidoreductase [Anaerolineaceae bacterium]
MFTTGKTILITGSTDGIGKQTAKGLVQQGARVLIHGRSAVNVQSTLKEITQEYPRAELDGYVADFSSLQAVRELAEQIQTKEPVLQVLINNAGTYSPDFQFSKDGFELTFAVNHLAPFLLTMLLLQKIKSNSLARIITVVSIAHTVRDLDISKINDEAGYKAWHAYKISKFANIVAMYELAERLKGSGVTVNCLHPGAVDTKMLHSAFPTTQGISIVEGAKSSIYLASSEEVAEISGAYFEDCKPVSSAPLTYDKEIQKVLWKKCEEWVGLSG